MYQRVKNKRGKGKDAFFKKQKEFTFEMHMHQIKFNISDTSDDVVTNILHRKRYLTCNRFSVSFFLKE
jgi:hypothetical protein